MSLTPTNFFSIRVNTLRGDQKIDFNIYVKVNDKHIMYCRQGDSFSGERLARLKQKKLKKMFIDTNDETKYRSYLSENMNVCYDAKSSKPVQEKVEIAQGLMASNTESIMENLSDKSLYDSTKFEMSKFFSLVNSDPKAIFHLLNITNSDQDVAHHGVSVATLACSVAKALSVNDEKQLQLLGLGALLHDLEHFHTGLFSAQPLAELSSEIKSKYLHHPDSGVLKLQDKTHFDQTVIDIIREHEEFIDGQGYPNKVTESKLNPLSVIVSLCNVADKILLTSSEARNQTGKKILVDYVGRFPLNHLKILEKILI
jgi:putative nucleotidyltransferase with HDIG domain